MDIVYILRNGIDGDELRYSLRSLQNLPHDKVWFFGGKPDGLTPDRQVEFQQDGVTVWAKVTRSIKKVCQNKEVSDNFYLFNDDFFIVRPMDSVPIYFDGTLLERAEGLRKKRKGLNSLYSFELLKLRETLMDSHLKTFNYAVHTPMVINKAKALEVFNKYPKETMFRSLYGNYWDIGGEQLPDVKIVRKDTEPDPDCTLLSTVETSFDNSKVGEFIRSRFTEKCQYED